MRFYAPVELGPTQRRTPEGFLVCEGVKLARTGKLLYAADELPMLQPDGVGVVTIERDPEEVFAPATMASAEGKTFVDDHPEEDVTPDNWRDLAKGHVQNVRRGEGADDIYMVGDLVVKDPSAIEAIEAGKREISLGYDAEYEQLETGVARQKNIIVNHVALVDKGRCGPACAIGDHAMSGNAKKTFGQRIAEIFATKDAAARQKMLDEEVPEGAGGLQSITVQLPELSRESSSGVTDAEWRKGMEDSMKGMRDAIDALCARDKARDAESEEEEEERRTDDEEGEGTEEERRERSEKTGDSIARLARHVAANAEILSPGFRVPTFDAKADPKRARARLCDCKRKALAAAYQTKDGQIAIDTFLHDIASRDFDRMATRTIDLAFDGAAALLAQRNNGVFRDVFAAAPPPGVKPAGVPSIADLNKSYREFWDKRSGAAH